MTWVIVFLLAVVSLSCAQRALTPPMGWNSYDSFLVSINETEYLANVHYMRDYLLPHGYEYAVIDAGWYADAADGNNMTDANMTTNGYSILVPNPTRFPSASKGGFKPLVEKLHSMGLKFGIHVMRGIWSSVVKENQPIEGTPYFAQDIAVKNDSCVWWKDWYGVNMSHPAAQAYYDNVFALYASWGVDYVKVDCIFGTRDGHLADILAISEAVSKASDTMLLSLSPGLGASPAEAEQINSKVNMYRITNDLWDCWDNTSTNAPCKSDDGVTIVDAFKTFPQFQSLIGQPGLTGNSWPDGDMLPLGIVNPPGQDHQMPTGLTQSEQYAFFTLWCIFRAPLIFGGDMTKMDNFTYSLLTNDDVLYMHKNSKDNQELYHSDTFYIWGANSTTDKSAYVAFFNIDDAEPQKYVFDFATIGLSGRYSVRDLWEQAEIGYYRDSIAVAVMPHSTVLYRITPHHL